MSKISWDNFFMSMAYFVSMKSKDPSSRIGAVIVGEDNEVISLGYNGLPRGVRDDVSEREERPIKYSFYEHGERNAIYNAARIGVSTRGARCYTQGTPCADCARALIQAGIKEIIVDFRWENHTCSNELREKWLASAKLSKEMLSEAGVSIRTYDGPLISEVQGLISGEVKHLSQPQNLVPLFNNDFPLLSFKDANENTYEVNPAYFQCTGIPPQLDDAIQQAREYGPQSLGTTGYFYDADGFLRDSSQINKFL